VPCGLTYLELSYGTHQRTPAAARQHRHEVRQHRAGLDGHHPRQLPDLQTSSLRDSSQEIRRPIEERGTDELE
ncbi:jg9183, partial [Pararge aegeria aegeria]